MMLGTIETRRAEGVSPRVLRVLLFSDSPVTELRLISIRAARLPESITVAPSAT